jgi:hypothetical protein
MNPAFIALLRDTPYVLMVETDRKSDGPLAVALGRSPDNYASNRGRIVATYHYTSFDNLVDGLRRVPTGRRAMVSDVRVPLSTPATGSEDQAEQNATRELILTNRALLSPPFMVSATYPDDFDATEVTGRAPFLVVGGVAIFTFDNFDDAVAACTRLAVADGTYDSKSQNTEIN